MSNIINGNLDNVEFIHPEISFDEVFFTNANSKNFEIMKFKTKRKGNQAYDGKGNSLQSNDWFPVFLRQSELNELTLSLHDIRKQFRIEQVSS